MYLTKPRDTDELKNAIEEEIKAAPDNMVREAMRTLHDRLEQCRRDSGKHLINVLFKK
jgi:ActR/RegA family two-component response regulator